MSTFALSTAISAIGTGIRSWILAMSSFGAQVAMAHVARRGPWSWRFMDQIPAKPKGRQT
jgi:hypothetical protein